MIRAVVTSALAVVCYADAVKFCSPINILGGQSEFSRVGACLYAHKEQLTEPACKEAMQKWNPTQKGKQK